MDSAKIIILSESDFTSFKICAVALTTEKFSQCPDIDVPFIAHIHNGAVEYFPLSRWDVLSGQFLTTRELWFVYVANSNKESNANFRCKASGVSMLVASETLCFEWSGGKWVGCRAFVDMDALEEIHTEDDLAIRDRYAEIALSGLISREEFKDQRAHETASKAWEIAECMTQLRK